VGVSDHHAVFVSLQFRTKWLIIKKFVTNAIWFKFPIIDSKQ